MRRAAGGSPLRSAGVANGFAAAAFACALLAVGPSTADAQTITMSMGATPAMRVNSATAGQPPDAVVVVVGTYTPTNNNSVRVIQARLSAAPPPGVTIEVNLATHASATSLGWVSLTTTYQNVVTGFPRNTTGTYALTYRVTATTAAGVTAASNRVMTLRLQ